MNEFQLTSMNGELYADSREVAERIERPHYELLKSIRKYCEFLTEGKIPVSEYFIPAQYEDSTGRELPCFLITKKGCDMIANKLTGRKGVLFTRCLCFGFRENARTALNAKFPSAFPREINLGRRGFKSYQERAYRYGTAGKPPAQNRKANGTLARSFRHSRYRGFCRTRAVGTD